MKKIAIVLIAAIYCTISFAQSGLTCNDAIPETANTTCIYTTYITTTTDIWFSFTATSPFAQISLIGADFGDFTNSHVHNITMFEGICTNLNKIEEDELPFIDIAEELIIDASGLTVGDTYYLRARREGAAACPTCVATGSPSAEFDLCIQAIEVFQPLDFNLAEFGFPELPANDHVYYTNKGQILDTDGNPRRDIKLYTKFASTDVYITDNAISHVLSKADLDTLQLRIEMTLVGGNPNTRVFKTEKASSQLNYYLGHIPTGIAKMKGYNKVVCNGVYPNVDMQLYSNSEGMKYYFITRPGGNPDDIVMKFEGATSVDVKSDGGLRVTTPLGNIEYEPGHAYAINPSGNVVPMPWQAKFEKVTSNSVKFDIHSFPSFMPLIIQVDKGHKFSTAGGPIRNLEHSTFLGGNGDDFGHDVQVDNTGNVYLTGITASTDFPVTVGVADTVLTDPTGSSDAFVVKFDALGEFLWATYYGGERGETSVSLIVSQDGHIYFAGNTRSTDFPTGDNTGTNPYFQDYMDDVHVNAEEGYVVGLNTDGTLYWASYFGGNTNDIIHKITEDNAGNLIICGEVSFLSNFPVDTIRVSDVQCLPPASPNNEGFPVCNPGGGVFYSETHYGGTGSGNDYDGFIAKFDNNRKLIYSTFLGGFKDDQILDIIVDPADNSYYITGLTESDITGNNPCSAPNNGGFPTCDPGGGAFYDGTYNFGTDAFIGKFSSSGVLLWMSYFGSNEGETGHHLALDGNGNLYLVGVGDIVSTTSFTDNPCGVPSLGNLGFPLCDPGGGAFFRAKTGIDASLDFFISKFDPNGKLIWSSYIGGLGPESAGLFNAADGSISIAIDGDNRVFIFGTSHTKTGGATTIDTLELGGFYYQPVNAGDITSLSSTDAYIAAFSGDSSKLLWASHLGADDGSGSNGDLGYGMTIDKSNKQLYVTGGTKKQFFPVACPPTAPNPFCDTVISDLYDAYLARFNIDFILTGIKENSIENVSSFILYPNPTSGNLMLSFDLKQSAEISVKLYNAVGQLLQADQLKARTGTVNHEMNLVGLPTGIYMITVKLDNEVIGKKFIKL